MLATTESVELVEFAEAIGKMVLESDIAQHYRTCLNKLKRSSEAQRKIDQFVKTKELYEEAQRFGRYHPDYKRVMIEVRQFKREMDLDPDVAEFKLAEMDLQSLL
ncbi:YlbF family regulator, partial [Bacillus sp. JJ1764]|uniref:YlbF family regulator n=1 Tax=Bacillus sp. JJ1764 TaxID=3122964 RepID=UPI003000B61C